MFVGNINITRWQNPFTVYQRVQQSQTLLFQFFKAPFANCLLLSQFVLLKLPTFCFKFNLCCDIY